MVARRIVMILAVMFAALLGAGCAAAVSGTGTIDPAAQALGGGGTDSPSGSSDPSESSDPSSSSSPDGTDSTDPSESSSSSSSSGGGGGGDEESVCNSLDKAAVQQAFGTSVTLADSQSTGCRISSSDNRSMIVAVYSALTLAEYKKGSFTSLTISAHPAIKTDSTIIYAARSANPAAPGMVAAYYGGLGSGGDPIAIKLIQQLLSKFGL